jgi:hypothetical protein
MQTVRKIAILFLLVLIMLPLFANYRLQQLAAEYSSLNDEAASNEIASILEQKTGILITKQAIVSQLSKLYSTIIYMSKDEETAEYTFTLPYLTDDAVLITRKGEDIEIMKEINTGNSDRIYAGFQNDSLFRSWLADSGFHNMNDDTETFADALELIIAHQADFTILPNHMAQRVISESGLGYTLTTSRTLFPIEYRIPVEISDVDSLVILNDELLKLDTKGTLTDIYFRKGIRSNAVIEQESQILRPAVLNLLLLFLCILSIIYFIRFYTNYRKTYVIGKKKTNKNDEVSSMTLNDKISLLTSRNSSISAKIAENRNTDPYSGFYNTQYLNGRISECFISYAKKGVPFSVAVINTNNRTSSSADTMNIMKEEISRLLKTPGTEAVAAYNGFGLFYVLFPNAGQDDALNAINKADCHFNNFSLTEYKGQDQYEFLGGLGL